MHLVRRYWVAGMVVAMVLFHAVIIGYVRSQINNLQELRSSTMPIGDFRFQTISDDEHVYQLSIHTVVAAPERLQAERGLKTYRIELKAQIEQVLRQVDSSWLHDPQHAQLRKRLAELLVENLSLSELEDVLITDYLKLPAVAVPHEYPANVSVAQGAASGPTAGS